MRNLLLAAAEYRRTHPIPLDRPPQFFFLSCNGCVHVHVQRSGRERRYEIGVEHAERVRARMTPHPIYGGWYLTTETFR